MASNAVYLPKRDTWDSTPKFPAFVIFVYFSNFQRADQSSKIDGSSTDNEWRRVPLEPQGACSAEEICFYW